MSRPALPAGFFCSHIQSAKLPLRSGLSLFLLVNLAAAAWGQTVYRSVGSDGKVVYADRPLGPDAKPLNLQAPGGSGDNALPFALREVVKQFPVTLFTGVSCSPCDAGRTFLRQRGIPFAERTVTTQADIDALMKQLATNAVPALRVGGQVLKGFSDAQWAQYLDAAGYPAVSMLPAQYQAPAPTPMAVPTAAPPAAQPPDETADDSGGAPTGKPEKPATPKVAPVAPAPRVDPANPAGIRF